MVERILEAAADVLHDAGIVDFGTRQVAEKADISVGSLYQYFDDKQAILQALGKHLSELIQTRLMAVLPQLTTAEPSQFVRILIMNAFEVLDEDDGRYLKLLQHWHILDFSKDVRHLERLIIQSIEVFSATHPELPRLPNMQRNLYMAVNAVLFNLLRYISEPSPFFSREALIEGLVEMLDMYFQNQYSQQES